MSEYSMTCSCGHEMKVEAGSRDEAVASLRSMMTQEALDQHFQERHQPTETKPTLEQTHAMIQQVLQPAAA